MDSSATATVVTPSGETSEWPVRKLGPANRKHSDVWLSSSTQVASSAPSVVVADNQTCVPSPGPARGTDPGENASWRKRPRWKPLDAWWGHSKLSWTRNSVHFKSGTHSWFLHQVNLLSQLWNSLNWPVDKKLTRLENDGRDFTVLCFANRKQLMMDWRQCFIWLSAVPGESVEWEVLHITHR